MDPASGRETSLDALQHSAVPKAESANVVFWVDIFILCFIAICTLFQSPRYFARLLSPDERGGGHFLSRNPVARTVASSPSLMKTSESSADLVERAHSGKLEQRTNAFVPQHIRAWPTVLRTTTAFLRIRFLGRIHLGGTMLLTFYFGLLLFAGLYRDSLFTNQIRAAYVAVSQIPFVVALAMKNNIISMLIGIGWDHMNYIHRFTGRLLVIAANVHAIGYIYRWTILGKFTRHIEQPRYIWGIVALVCVDVLFFFSLAIWRQRAYNVFFVSHVVAFILFLVAVCFHMRDALPYVLVGAGIYVVDLLLRFAKTRICAANLQALPELDMTSLQIPTLNAGWRAGQHVRLRVLSTGMGWHGWAETHPFTIASASMGTAQQGLVILAKNTGRWTQRLYNIAAGSPFGEGSNVIVKVMVEGPYGGPGNTVISSFSGALFVVGGSGISYALSSVEELLEKAARGTSSVAVVDLIWCVKYPDSLIPLASIFSSLLLESAAGPTALQISVFFTRAPTAGHSLKAFDLPAGMTLDSGHPNIPCRLADLVERTKARQAAAGTRAKPRGVLVGTCGPLALGEVVREAIDGLDELLYETVGGIELNEEIYSL